MQVYAWDKKKKRYVKANLNELKQRGQIKRKNEAGVQIDFKKEKKFYEKWMAKTNLRIQEPGETVSNECLVRGTGRAGGLGQAGDPQARRTTPPPHGTLFIATAPPGEL